MDITTAKVSVNTIVVDPCTVKLQIEVPVEIAQPIYKKLLKNTAAKASFPGFRTGKLPVSMLLKHYGARIMAETTDQLVQEGYRQAMADSEYKDRVASDPELGEDMALYEDGKPYAFTITLELVPEFQLPEYKGIQLSKEVIPFTDKDLDDNIQHMLDMCVRYEEDNEKAAEAGNVLTVTYNAALPEGLELPEGAKYLTNAEKTWVALREPESLPGITSVLQGVKVGEEKEADIAFPEDYHEEALKGKTLHYTFKIESIRKEIRPDFNDEFVKQFGSNSVDEFKDVMRKRYEASNENTARTKLFKQIDELVFDKLDFQLPAKMLENTKNNILRGKLETEQRNGADKEALAAKLEELTAEAQKEAEKGLRSFYAFQAIIKQEALEFTKENQEQMNRYFIMQNPGKSVAQILKDKSLGASINNYVHNTLVNKMYERIIELAQVVETQPAENK